LETHDNTRAFPFIFSRVVINKNIHRHLSPPPGVIRNPTEGLSLEGEGALLYIPLSTFCSIFSGMAQSHIYDGT